MQRIWEFIAVKKLTPEELEHNKEPLGKKIDPFVVHRYYNTQSSRMSKVSEKIYKELKESFKLGKHDLENFFLKLIR